MLEAIRMYERGDATAEDIDTAMKLGAGLPMGEDDLFHLVFIQFWINSIDAHLLFPTMLQGPSNCRTWVVSVSSEEKKNYLLYDWLNQFLAFFQFVGLDTLSHIARGWRQERVETGELDAKSVEQVDVLERLVKDGKTGRKSGEGFFKCEREISSLILSVNVRRNW